MALIKEQYTPNGINRVYQLLKNEAEKAIAKEYDIRVDLLKVVNRTNEPERFFEHEAFLTAESKSITINIYDGSSPRCTKYILMLSDESPAKETLSGIEKTVEARMQQERINWEYDRQKKEIGRLTQELESSERYTLQLQERISSMQAEKLSLPGKLTNTLISLAGAYITRNPQALSGMAGLGKMLHGGAIGQHEAEEQIINDADVRAEQNDEATQATFSRQGPMLYTGEVTEEDFGRLEEALIPIFPDEYRETVVTVLKLMYNDSHLIPEIASLLDSEKGTT